MSVQNCVQHSQETQSRSLRRYRPDRPEVMPLLPRAKRRAMNAARRAQLVEWKAQNGVDAETKVFVMDPPSKNPQADLAVKEHLEALGWHLNPATEAPESLMFDMRFQRLRRRKSRDAGGSPSGGVLGGDHGKVGPPPSADDEPLAPFQISNHFRCTSDLTTKDGLANTLRSCRFSGDLEPDDFAPRSYCMDVPSDLALFYDDYRQVAAECVLHQIVRYACANGGAVAAVNQGLLDAALAVCQRHVRANDMCSEDPADKMKDQKDPGSITDQPVSAAEWEVLMAAQRNPTSVKGWHGVRVADSILLSPDGPPNQETELEQTIGAAADSRGNFNGDDAMSSASSASNSSSTSVVATLRETLQERLSQKAEIARRNMAARAREIALERGRQIAPIGTRLADAVICLKTLAQVGGRQHTLHAGAHSAENLARYGDMEHVPRADGDNRYQNLWIVKPAKLSRGRGIRVFENLHELLVYCGIVGRSDVAQLWKRWVVQKYIERPLTIAGHKWDMRQWVLVACWNPVVVFMSEDCYARFAVEAYDTAANERVTTTASDDDDEDEDEDAGSDDDDDLDPAEAKRWAKKAAKFNQTGGFVHLVNNSVSKYSKDFNKTFSSEDGQIVKGHMWNNKQLAQYLNWHASRHSQKHRREAKVSSHDVYSTIVKPAMQKIVHAVVNCSLGRPERENDWEIFGFDFFIDETYHPWLIEINSSPAVDYSTEVTEAYCSRGMVDGCKVALDWKPWWLQLRQKHQTAKAAAAVEKKKTAKKAAAESVVEAVELSPPKTVGDQEISTDRKDAGEGECTTKRCIEGLTQADWDAAPSTGAWELLTRRSDLLNEEIDLENQALRSSELPNVCGTSIKTIQKAIRARRKQERLDREKQAAIAERRAQIKRDQKLREQKVRSAHQPDVTNQRPASTATLLRSRGSIGPQPERLGPMEPVAPPPRTAELRTHLYRLIPVHGQGQDLASNFAPTYTSPVWPAYQPNDKHLEKTPKLLGRVQQQQTDAIVERVARLSFLQPKHSTKVKLDGRPSTLEPFVLSRNSSRPRVPQHRALRHGNTPTTPAHLVHMRGAWSLRAHLDANSRRCQASAHRQFRVAQEAIKLQWQDLQIGASSLHKTSDTQLS